MSGSDGLTGVQIGSRWHPLIPRKRQQKRQRGNMATHRGWRIKSVPRRGIVLGMVLRAGGGGYRTKSFSGDAAATRAREWARRESALETLGVGAGESVSAVTSELAAVYLKAQAARRRSDSHLANVRHTLAAMAEAVPDLADDRAHRHMEAWLDGLRMRRVGRHARNDGAMPSPAYRNRVMAEARAFCRWLVRKEYLRVDPSRTLEAVAVDDVLKAQFSVDEVVQLCALPSPDPARQRRVALMLLAGLRSNEAAALTWGDIEGGIIFVRKHAGYGLKRNKERVVPLQPALAGILGERGQRSDRVAPLRGDASTVQHGRHFRLYLKAIGMAVAGRTPHSCRHTYGALMTATGCPSILVQAYMGHATVATTARYAREAPRHVPAVKGWPMGELRVGIDPAAPWGPPSP